MLHQQGLCSLRVLRRGEMGGGRRAEKRLGRSPHGSTNRPRWTPGATGRSCDDRRLLRRRREAVVTDADDLAVDAVLGPHFAQRLLHDWPLGGGQRQG